MDMDLRAQLELKMLKLEQQLSTLNLLEHPVQITALCKSIAELRQQIAAL